MLMKMVLQKIPGVQEALVVEISEILTESSCKVAVSWACCSTGVITAVYRLTAPREAVCVNTKPQENPACRKIKFCQNSGAVLERYMNR